ncbi:MAG: hypothetical protein IMF09_10510 [Proteobacteria bacterium]|nr:hypothetical protein [Pseudomonadota bacterium]
MKVAETQQISATDLARNMAWTIDDVRISNTTVLITKGTRVIAQLSPPPKSGLSVQGLIKLLEAMPGLASTDAKQFSDDINTVRKAAILGSDPWD